MGRAEGKGHVSFMGQLYYLVRRTPHLPLIYQGRVISALYWTSLPLAFWRAVPIYIFPNPPSQFIQHHCPLAVRYHRSSNRLSSLPILQIQT
jgi:hypothetical protein